MKKLIATTASLLLGVALSIGDFQYPKLANILLVVSSVLFIWMLLTCRPVSSWLRRIGGAHARTLSIIVGIILVSGANVPIYMLNADGEEKQIYEPILRVDHEAFVQWRDQSAFDLLLVNSGLADVENIRIYEDWYVAVKTDTVILVRFGVFLILPNTTLDNLPSKTETPFTITLPAAVYDRMSKFYRAQKGPRMEAVNLVIKYRRTVDGKEFMKHKLFLVTSGDPPLLINYDSSGAGPLPGSGFSSEELREAISHHEDSHK